MNNKKIFVSIPAWEDTELVDTINKCLSAAKYPENIVFGIGMNYEVEPYLRDFSNKILIVRDKEDYGDIQNPGIIQVRAKIRSLITDEEYFMSIDAHANFEDGWDQTLISDIDSLPEKYVISKQIMAPGDKNNYYSKWQISDRDITAQPRSIDKDLEMVNDNYFLNYYTSGNFIFGRTSWIKSMTFPDYHGFPYEEPEMAVALFCNGFEVVSPTGEHCPISAGNDPKYMFPYDEKWWNFIGTDRNNPNHWEKVWVMDDSEMTKEVLKLMFTGNNKYFTLENLERSVFDFYKSIGLEQEHRQVFNKINV